jgi:hypothetical protein
MTHPYVRHLAGKMAGGRHDRIDDLIQEGAVALLELGSPSELSASDRLFVSRRMKECANAMGERGAASLDCPMGEDGTLTLGGTVTDHTDRLRRGVTWVTGPYTIARNKQAKWRHSCSKHGRCVRCGRKLPSREFAKCLICRAKRSWDRRARSKSVSRRRSSLFDQVIVLLGLDLSLTKEAPLAQTAIHCSHCGKETIRHGRDRDGNLRVRCRTCGRTSVQKLLDLSEAS